MPTISVSYNRLKKHGHRELEGAKKGAPLPFTLEQYTKLVGKALSLGECPICELDLTHDNFSPDHSIPLSRGGTSDLSNIQILCWECNEWKGGQATLEFLLYDTMAMNNIRARKALKSLTKRHTQYGHGVPFHPDEFYARVWMAVQDGTCPYCFGPLTYDNFSPDHRIPLSAGGSPDLLNIEIVCAPCNLHKGPSSNLPEATRGYWYTRYAEAAKRKARAKGDTT